MNTLKNGAEILEQQNNVVLAKTDRDFVTWQITDSGDCYWGHYYPRSNENALVDAVEDFHQRVSK